MQSEWQEGQSCTVTGMSSYVEGIPKTLFVWKFRKLRYSWNCLNGLIYLSHGMIERTLCQLLPGPSLAANPVELLRVFTSFTLFNDLDGGRLDLSRLSDFRFCKDIATWGPGASLQSDFTCKKIPSLEYNGSRYYTKSWFWFSARLSNPFCQVRDLFCRNAVTSHASVHGDVTMALCRVTSCNGREGGRWAKKLSKLPTVQWCWLTEIL